MPQSLKEAIQSVLDQTPVPAYDADKLLRELLCVFCRDGGQAIEERGILGAIEVAQGNFYAMNEICEKVKNFTELMNNRTAVFPLSFSPELKPVPFEVKVTINEAPKKSAKRLLSGDFSSDHKNFATSVRLVFDETPARPTLLDTKVWSDILGAGGYPKWAIDVVVKRLAFNIMNYKHPSDIINFVVRLVGTKEERKIVDWHPDDCINFFNCMVNMEFGDSQISIEYTLQLLRTYRAPQWLVEEVVEDAHRIRYVPLKGLMKHVNYLVNNKDQ